MDGNQQNTEYKIVKTLSTQYTTSELNAIYMLRSVKAVLNVLRVTRRYEKILQ